MVVRMRHTRGHTQNRRSHHRLSELTLSKDEGISHLRHRASPISGKYRGKVVIDVLKKVNKKVSKKVKKQEKK